MTELIALSGLIKSGKDTVYRMIVDKTLREGPAPSWIHRLVGHKTVLHETWQNRKFAEKLKQMIALALGVPREQIEQQDFKENWFWNVTTGELLSREELALRIHLGAPVIETVESYYPKFSWISVRVLLQDFGTECVRARFPEFWVNATMADWRPGERWVLTDCRFVNEALAVKRRGGIVVRVENPRSLQTGHASETALKGYPFDYVIHNNASLEDLSGIVDHLLRHFKIT